MKEWNDLVSTALLGTRRRPFDVTTLPPEARRLAETRDDPAEQLLTGAAALTAVRRAGAQPLTGVALPEPAGADERPFVPPLARERLARLLAANHPDLLKEWLLAVGHRNLRVPPEMVPALAEAGRTRPALRLPVAAVAGPLGAWLGARNPEWTFLVAAREDGDEDVWQYGTLAQRKRRLAKQLTTDPDGAREALTGSWRREPADARADFLGVLGEHLRDTDEPFLDAALGDRAAAVRQLATELLGRIPGAALGLRMADRLRPLVSVRAEHVLTIAAEGAGDERAGQLRATIAATPLEFWTAFGPPADVVRMQVDGIPPGVLRESWSAAALRQRDAVWAETLIGADPGGRGTAALIGLLPPARQAAMVAHLVSRLKPELFARLVHELPRPWPPELGDQLLTWATLQEDNRAVAHAAVVIARAVPIACLNHPLGAGPPPPDAAPWRRSLAETLNFRRQMHEELP